ncbi:glucosamine-6-phosphate deaminase [Aureibacillus halotolerans]|uniref:glucosamine-6-phosphate deaminase n=1 Tax=Aureibacillus halotolerans TaxID=1508390 RepID=UPI00105D371D|nr:glucosamine-6-phosphate deaminase [Aureibacillus halotolerans]
MKIVNGKDGLAKEAANYIVEHLKKRDASVLGLATGSTPVGTYKELIAMHKEGKVSFANVHTFNLDEYVGLKNTDTNSYHYYMKELFFSHIDVPEDQFHLPKGTAEDIEAECHTYEKLIRQTGGIDLQLLGIGTNGHIGFNEPGTSFQSRTHVVTLDESTREANARFFDAIEDVPTHAITMGIESILEAKDILLLVAGKEKGEALSELLYGDVREDIPATALRKHPSVTVIVDTEAYQAAKIPGEENLYGG